MVPRLKGPAPTSSSWRATPATAASPRGATRCPTSRTRARSSPSRSPASTPCSSATPTSRSRSATSRTRMTGKQVLLSEPYYWGMRVTRMSLDLQKVRGSGRSCTRRRPSTTPTSHPRTPPSRVRCPPRTRRSSPTSTASSARARRPCRPRRHATRTPPRSTSSTSSRPTRSRRHSRARPRRPPRAVDRRAVQQARRDPRRRRHDPRRGRPLHLRQHAARIVLTGAQVKAYLEKSAGYFQPCTTTGPVAADTITGAKRDPRLQLRHHGWARRRPHLRHRPRQRRRLAHRGPRVCRQPRRVGRPLRRGDQQLPPVRWRRLPRRRDRPGRLQPSDRDPSAAHRLATANKVIDPSTFSSLDWKLVSNGKPITVTP